MIICSRILNSVRLLSSVCNFLVAVFSFMTLTLLSGCSSILPSLDNNNQQYVQHRLVKKTETMSKDLHGILQFIFQKKFGQSKLCISVFENKRKPNSFIFKRNMAKTHFTYVFLHSRGLNKKVQCIKYILYIRT